MIETIDQGERDIGRTRGRTLRRCLEAGLLLLGATLLSPVQAQTSPTDPYNYSRSSSFTYRADGLLASEKVEPNTPSQCVETVYGYTGLGNRNIATTRNCTGSGASGNAVFQERGSSTEYAAYTVTINVAGTPTAVNVSAETFATKSTNAAGQFETRKVDPRFGALVELTGPNSLTTRYTLDDWGRVTRETRADSTSTRSFYCIRTGQTAGSLAIDTSSNSAECGASTSPLSGNDGEVPVLARSFVQVQSFDATGAVMGPAQRVYKDAEGRSIREVAEGFDGGVQPGNRRYIVKDTVYNSYGVAEISTGAYFLDSNNNSATLTGSNDVALTLTTVDALGRSIQVDQRDPKGNVGGVTIGSYGSFTVSRTVITYSGLTTITANPLSQTRVEEKNANGLVARVTDAYGAQVAYQHDAFGNLLQTQDALQNLVKLSYDTRGRKLSMDDPDTGRWTYDYNALGELVAQQSPNQRAAGQVTTMAYDLLGRMTSRVEPEYTSTWVYDNCNKGVGKLCSTSTTHGVNKSFSYDTMGRPETSRVAITNGPSFNSRVAYQANTGRLASQTYPTGLNVAYNYSDKGYLNQVISGQALTITPDTAPGQAAGATVTWAAGKVLWSAGTVNARGQAESQSLGNGITSRASFDGPSGRLNDIQAGPGTSNSAVAYNYVWDALGNLKERNDLNGDGLTGTVKDSYVYDSLNRLTQYTVEATNAANLKRTVDLHYNAMGNLLYKSDVGNYVYPDYGNASGTTRTRPHALSQLVRASGTITYTYDANGNATTANGGAWRSISYTSFNLPDSNNGAQGPNGLKYTWFYDENHQRLKETRGNGYGTRTTWNVHPDNQGGLGFETESTNGSVNLNRHYIAAGSQTLVIVTRQALTVYAASTATAPGTNPGNAIKVEYWHKDHLGSLIATTDHNGTVTARYAYDPFGKRRQTNGTYDEFGTLVIDWVDGSSKGTDRGWTGHEHLDDLGIVHMNGRLFDPLTGRFLQADPLNQDPFNLQNYNRYTYCYNSPLICTDPTGYFNLKKIIKSAVAIVAAIYLGPILANYFAFAALDAGIMIGSEIAFGNMMGAAVAGFTSGAISGGSFKSGIQGAFSAGLFSGVGELVGSAGLGAAGNIESANKFASAVILHGVAGCVSSVSGGGKCGPGALSAAFSKIALPITAGMETGGRAVAHAVIGGTASALGGGSFLNGASTGAFSYLFNECLHTRMCGSNNVKAEIQGNVAAGKLGELTEPTSIHLSVTISDGYSGITTLDGQPAPFGFLNCQYTLCLNSNISFEPKSNVVWGPYNLAAPSGMTNSEFASLLISNAQGYRNWSLSYGFPSIPSGNMGWGYNSNSWASGLLTRTLGSAPSFRFAPYQAPGYSKPADWLFP